MSDEIEENLEAEVAGGRAAVEPGAAEEESEGGNVRDNVAESEAVKSELKTSYKMLMDTLSQEYPRAIEQVKMFVHEMRRITLLREELWLGT